MESSIKTGAVLKNSVLQALDKFGWLTADQVGHACFAHSKNPGVRARLKLRQMQERGEVEGVWTSEATRAWTLRGAGRRALESTGERTAKTDKKASVHHAIEHTAAATWTALTQGDRGWNEYSVLTGQAPVGKAGFLGKVPDALYAIGSELIWVEVEQAWKNKENRAKLLDFAAAALSSGPKMIEIGDYALSRIEIVCTNASALRAMGRTVKDYATHLKPMQLALLQLTLQEIRPGLALGARRGTWSAQEFLDI
ncbi:MAG: hypothetical protein ACK57J_22815 [Rubrivivax sp.]